MGRNDRWHRAHHLVGSPVARSPLVADRVPLHDLRPVADDDAWQAGAAHRPLGSQSGSRIASVLFIPYVALFALGQGDASSCACGRVLTASWLTGREGVQIRFTYDTSCWSTWPLPRPQRPGFFELTDIAILATPRHEVSALSMSLIGDWPHIFSIPNCRYRANRSSVHSLQNHHGLPSNQSSNLQYQSVTFLFISFQSHFPFWVVLIKPSIMNWHHCVCRRYFAKVSSVLWRTSALKLKKVKLNVDY